jgi:hypothetical protein
MTLILSLAVAWLALDAVFCILWSYLCGGGTR